VTWAPGSAAAALKHGYLFNTTCARTKQAKPEDEWVRVPLAAFIPAALFDAVEQRSRMRSPQVTPVRVVNSPTLLLTGLLRCDNYGAGMNLATGKGGRYRYYKCNTRIGQSIHACSTPAVRWANSMLPCSVRWPTRC
jgi:site-specific DNA recombinase